MNANLKCRFHFLRDHLWEDRAPISDMENALFHQCNARVFQLMVGSSLWLEGNVWNVILVPALLKQ